MLEVYIPVDVHQVMADLMGIAADDLNRAKDAELGMMDLVSAGALRRRSSPTLAPLTAT